jgi:hypothetical protein
MDLLGSNICNENVCKKITASIINYMYKFLLIA